MKRRLYLILGVASLLLCATTAWLWARSYRVNDNGYATGGDRWFYYTSLRGAVAVYGWHRSDVDKPLFHYRHECAPASDRRADPYELVPHAGGRLGFWGLWYLDPSNYTNIPSARQVIVPFRFPTALTFGFGVAFLWASDRARRRRRRGLCPACGYDLRASGERCPECGTTVRRASPSAPSPA